MKYYACYDQVSGVLSHVGTVLPDPLPDTIGVLELPIVPPHASFWDVTIRNYLIPLSLSDEIKAQLQMFQTERALNGFLTLMADVRPSLPTGTLRGAITRALHGPMTYQDYTLLNSLEELNLSANVDTHHTLVGLVQTVQTARAAGKWEMAKAAHDQIKTMGHDIRFRADGFIEVIQ